MGRLRLAAAAATIACGQNGRKGDLLALAGVSAAEPSGSRGGRIGEHCCPASHPSFRVLSRLRLGRTSLQRGEIPLPSTSAHLSDVDRLSTEPMGKSSHLPHDYFTTLLVCRLVALAGRWELRPISWAVGAYSSKGHLVSRPAQSQSLPEAPSKIRATAATNPTDTTTKEVRSRERERSC